MTMVSSLLKAVIEIAKVVPCQALPPAIDALLLATSTPSTLLISSVVDHLSQFLDELALSGKDLGDEEDLLTALMSVIVHLYEISDNVEHLLPSILWTVFVPLLQISRVSTTALCNNVIQALADVFSSKEAWGYAEESLFPYFLKTIDASLERDKGGEINSERGNSYSAPIFSSDNKKVCFEPVALHVVCHVLAALLLKISHLIEIKPLGEECPSSSLEETFCMNLILKFFHPILSLISKTSHDGERQCAISIFLPPALRILYKLKARVLTEQMEQIYRDLWTVLLALFVRGCIHRQDAYSALLVSIGFLLSSPCANNLAGENEMKQNSFSILDDMELWNILKSGMVDSDPLTRKRALQTLKEVLNLGPLCQSTKFQSQTDSRVSTSSFPHLLTKRDTYAAQEARSLGLWNHETEHWKAFFLLYDMLEEYGTHLVEAAWKHQIGVLLPTLCGEDDKVQASHDPVLMGKCYLQNLETSIWWMTVLWERGFAHDNPQVRRLILQSFIELDWVKIPNLGEIVPEKFILGALASALNDPIHHKDFGVKGTYSSEMAAAATSFFNLYAMSLGVRDRTNFVIKMAGDSCVRPLCRQGFMTLIMCLDAVASTPADEKDNTTSTADVSLNSDRQSVTAPLTISVIDSLGVLVEESKKHFNPKYRLKVCYHLLRAARSVVMLQELPYRKFFWFLSLFPLEFIGSRGKLHQDLWAWLISGFYKIDPLSSSGFQTWMTEGLLHRAETFIKPTPNMTDSVTDEDVKAWTQEADKWAKITSLGFLESNNVSRLMVFLRDHTVGIYQRAYNSTCIPEKLLILLVSIIKMFHCFPKDCQPSNYMSQGMERQCTSSPFDIIAANLKSIISLNMDEFLAHAQRVSSVFWDDEVHSDAALPSSVINKLGGRSQRRLPLTVASNVLKAVVSITTVAECISWMLENNSSRISDSSIYFVWEFTWKSVTMKKAKQETKAEIQLSMYEALAPVLKALALSASPHVMSLVNRAVIFGDLQNESILDIITLKFTEAINQLLYGHVLARSRRAVLSVHKWCCLEGLLSIPKWRMTQIDHSERLDICALSDSILKTILVDAISSLESASDDNMLPVLRCLRWLLHWGILSRIDSYEADGESRKVVEVVWSLVRAAWAAIADSNKRRVGLISAFLSAIIHPNIFYQVTMHESNGDAGPLKWLLVNIFKLGSRSPRTMRLTAMHVSGMWLKYPNIVQYYVKELKLLSLHGGESVDEELDGQVSENLEAAREYSFLTQSLDPELVEEFRNSEQYVRVTVAVLLHKLAEIVERDQGSDEVEKRKAANSISVCGKELLLDMLDSLAYDKEMSKELYKKKSAIHRRKVRAWQMLCILSRFVQDEMIEQVMDVLEICLFVRFKRNSYLTRTAFLFCSLSPRFGVLIYLSGVQTSMYARLRDTPKAGGKKISLMLSIMTMTHQ
ncbi:hypothetical protein KP509_11G065800 [Ceratopteris richardii]|uniref:Uncharacterized protein n=1 Tax=Ceratopteris richardii TaxID=49495 RepID=A0A8T2TW55_CERRI|nr:hypothetical protein KP509_11G065800 [Ceratopteris richardii]